MTDLRKVSGSPSRFDRQAGRIVALLVVAVAIAIVKPWGSAVGPAAVAPPAPTPTAAPSVAPSAGPYLFDFLTFGTNEPPPGWEIWPAGNLASFHFAMRVDLTATGATGTGAAASTSPSTPPADASATPIPVATPVASPGSGPVPTAWPTIRIPVGSDLDLIGLNRPLGYSVPGVTLVRLDGGGGAGPAHAVIGGSPWPDHFTIVGFAAGSGSDAMQTWPAGRYRLDVVIEPGHVTRSVEVVIEAGTPDPSASPGGSAAPGS